jgi:hypothetical protein
VQTGGVEMCRVGADGTFRVAAAPKKEHRLHAWAEREGRFWNAMVTPKPSGAVLEVVLRPPGEQVRSVQVRIVDANGDVVSFARVVRLTNAGTVTNDLIGGRFPLVLSPDYTHTIQVFDARSRDGSRPGATVVRVGPDAGDSPVIRLPESREITGWVLDAAGSPVRGVLVRAFPEDEMTKDIQRRFQVPDAIAWTDAKGTFALEGLGERAYRVKCDVPPRHVAPPERVVAAGTRDLDIRLAASRSVTLTFLDGGDAPVAGVVVHLYLDGSKPLVKQRAETDPRGVVRFEGLDPKATYRVYGNAPPGRSDLWPATLRDTGFRPRDAVFRFQPGYTVTGVVRNASERPVAGAGVEVVDEWKRWRHVALSKEDGTFEAHGLPEGRVRLRARMDRFTGEPVEARAGDRGVALRLDLDGK